jgi:hypothetical protein
MNNRQDQLDISLIDDMRGTQQQRRIARFERRDDDGHLLRVINTAYVTDSPTPYETVVSEPCYNQGGWIVVQCYNDPASALIGHREWVETMENTSPDELIDVSGCAVAIMADDIKEGQEWRVNRRHDSEIVGGVSYMWVAQEEKTNVQSEEYVW